MPLISKALQDGLNSLGQRDDLLPFLFRLGPLQNGLIILDILPSQVDHFSRPHSGIEQQKDNPLCVFLQHCIRPGLFLDLAGSLEDP